MAVLIALHFLGAVVWVGGMFFAYMALRPAAGDMAPAERLGLWRRTLDNFFPWVWGSIAALLGSGYGLIIAFPGLADGIHVHIMQLLGWIMILIFCHVYFSPYRRLRAALDGGDVETAANKLGQIRLMFGANLILGLITILIGATGRFWA